MASYVVMERGQGPATEARFIRDGFSWLGLILPLLWLLWHRLWIEALLFLALSLGLGLLAERGGVWTVLVPVASLVVGLYVAIDGAALRIAAWRRRGWREWGVVRAGGLADAELRHAVEARPEAPVPAPGRAGSPPTPAPVPVQRGGPALGLLAYPGKP